MKRTTLIYSLVLGIALSAIIAGRDIYDRLHPHASVETPAAIIGSGVVVDADAVFAAANGPNKLPHGRKLVIVYSDHEAPDHDMWVTALMSLNGDRQPCTLIRSAVGATAADRLTPLSKAEWFNCPEMNMPPTQGETHEIN